MKSSDNSLFILSFSLDNCQSLIRFYNMPNKYFNISNQNYHQLYFISNTLTIMEVNRRQPRDIVTVSKLNKL